MRTALVAAAFLMLELPGPAGQETASKFVVGVLRRDGIVSPFAAFDGRRWRAPWPPDIRSREIPIALDQVPESWWGVDPPPRTMTIWRDGERAGSVNLIAVTVGRLMCEPRIAVKTDYKPATPPPPPFEMPYPKDGLVVSGDVRVERIASIEQGSPDWDRALALITAQFNEEETNATRGFSTWSHPVGGSQRRRVPIAIEALYRAPTGDPAWTAYFVEAVRQYPPGRDDRDGCGLATFASGWMLVGPRDEVRLRLTAKITYCDRKGVSYMLPLGLIRTGGKVFWLYQFSGFEEEWYEIAEPRSGKIEGQVSYLAGSC